MPTLPVLFAVRSSWVVILLLLIGVGFVTWFVIRVVSDAIAWFRDELFDEYRDLRKQSEEARKAQRKTGAENEEQTPGPDASEGDTV